MEKTKDGNTATLGFEAKLWHAADLMRGKLPATQYRQVLMGLLFLRYVSDAFENRYRELKAEGYGDEEDRDAYIAAVAHEANNGETIDNAKIAAAFEAFRSGKFEKEEGFAAVAATKEIAEKKFKLTPGLYAGGKVEEDDGEPFDAKMKRLTGELKGLFGESARLEAAIRKNLKAIGYEV